MALFMTKAKKGILIAASVAGVLLIGYIAGAFYFQNKFLPRTVINGVACTGKSVSAVQNAIQQAAGNYELTIVARDGKEETIKGSDIQMSVEFGNTLQNILNQQFNWNWVGALFVPDVHNTDEIVKYDEKALKKKMAALTCMDTSKMRKPVSATLKKDAAEGYVVVPEQEGTLIDKEGFWKALNQSVVTLERELVLADKKCYVEPVVREDSATLKKTKKQLEKLENITITYEFGDKQETLSGKEILEWIEVKNGKAELSQEDALAYVKELARSYNTVYRDKTLKSSWGPTVTIHGGSYGWKIDNEAELAQLQADVDAAKNVSREPVYAQTANSRTGNDYGDTYVEINLTAQHLYFYKNGQLIVESDFVSGDISNGNGTPVGAYPVTYTEKDATLNGANYSSFVNYWMPYCGNVGMHDASWRGSFGGTIYKRDGSHGCVNLPYSAAKTIFENIEKGYPVLVYELPGTESPKGVAMDQGAAVSAAIDTIGPVSLASQGVIASCRAQYDALSDEAKAYVSNYGVLLAAEGTYSTLVATEAENQANAEAMGQAEAVIKLINEIGEVTADSKDKIIRARKAYDKLSDRAKGFVSNYGVLTIAEEKYASLQS